MNSHESNAVPPEIHETDELGLSWPIRDWLRRVWACNPFYLLSAGLLLFGLYRMTLDPMFDSRSLARLNFTFGSLQVYELVLVAVAVFLARRSIFYDATLLVSLENLLLMVPFILLTAAGFENQPALWTFTLAGVALAIGRSIGARRWMTGLEVSVGLTVLAVAFVLVNAVVPFLFQQAHGAMESGSAGGQDGLTLLQAVAWYGLLPLLVATVNLLPRRQAESNRTPQRPWLSLLWMGMWSVATGVHFWCIRYVFDLAWAVDVAAPALWVAAWTVRHRVTDIQAVPSVVVRRLVLVLPAVVALSGVLQRANDVYLVLTALNIAAYAVLWKRDRSDRWLMHLLLISVAGLVAGLPIEPRRYMLLAGLGSYFLVVTMMLRTPWVTVAGGCVVWATVCGFLAPLPDAVSIGLQCGLVFALVHSLRWNETTSREFGVVRWIIAGTWLFHTWVWVGECDKAAWILVVGLAGLLLVAYGIARLLTSRWYSLAIPAAAFLAVLSYPVKRAIIGLEHTPSGFMAVLVSFVLLGIGTAVAVWRHQHHEQNGHPS